MRKLFYPSVEDLDFLIQLRGRFCDQRVIDTVACVVILVHAEFLAPMPLDFLLSELD